MGVEGTYKAIPLQPYRSIFVKIYAGRAPVPVAGRVYVAFPSHHSAGDAHPIEGIFQHHLRVVFVHVVVSLSISLVAKGLIDIPIILHAMGLVKCRVCLLVSPSPLLFIFCYHTVYICLYEL